MATQNPPGSSDPRDLIVNAGNLDVLVTSKEKLSQNDRLGVPRKTWHGMEVEFEAAQSDRASEFSSTQLAYRKAIRDTGLQVLGEYAAGIEFTDYNQAVRLDGEFWKPAASTALPYTTTGAGMPESGAFVAVGDAVLRQELAGSLTSGEGALKVNGSLIYVDSLADILELPFDSLTEGQQISVSDFWGDANFALANPYKGGGVFICVSGSNPHTGGLVIDPSVPHPDDQAGSTESERLSNYLDGVGATGSPVRLIRLPDGSIGIRPEWFGARGEARIYREAATNNIILQPAAPFDDSICFQKIVDIIEEGISPEGAWEASGTGKTTIQLMDGAGYYFASTVVTQGNLRLLGAANPKMIVQGPNSFITGAQGLSDGLFFITGSTGFVGARTYGFELDHVGFRGYGPSAGRLECAIRSEARNAPARPFNVLSSHFENFQDAILFDITTSDLGGTTGTYNINVTNGSVFRNNSYAIRSKGPNALGGLYFVGNVSEQGGRIRCEQGAAFGVITISDNLLEGQVDTLHIEGGLVHATIGPNYWERNTGYDLYFAATNSRASLTVETQFISSSADRMKVALGGSAGTINFKGNVDYFRVDVLDRAGVDGINFNPKFDGFTLPLVPPSELGGPFRMVTLLDKEGAQGSVRPLPSYTLSSAVDRYSESAGRFLITSEYGSMWTRKPNSNHQFSGFADSVSVGDALVFCGMIYFDGSTSDARSGNYQLLLGDATNRPAGAITPLQPGWNRVMLVVEATEAATSARWQILTGGLDMDKVYLGTSVSYRVAKQSAGIRQRLPWVMPVDIVEGV